MRLKFMKDDGALIILYDQHTPAFCPRCRRNDFENQRGLVRHLTKCPAILKEGRKVMVAKVVRHSSRVHERNGFKTFKAERRRERRNFVA